MSLTEYGRIAKNRYQREWRARNKAKNHDCQDEYWNRKGELIYKEELESMKDGKQDFNSRD